MRHIIDAVAAQGRDKDTELLHVTRSELAGLDALKRHLSGSGLSKNPRTGIPEAGFFDQYVVPVLPAVAGLAAGAMTGGTMAAPAAALAGAATGAGTKAIQGGSTQDTIMGGIMGGIAGYGAGGIGAGLAGAGEAAGGNAIASAGQGSGLVPNAAPVATDATSITGVTPMSTTGNNLLAQNSGTGLKLGSDVGSSGLKLGSDVGSSGLKLGTDTAATTPNASMAGEANLKMPASGVKSLGGNTGGINWGSLASKDTLSSAVPIATGTMGMAAINPQSGTNTGLEPVDESMPEAEVYYTPYGERRTRIKAAEGGLMGFADYDAADAEKDGGYAPGGIAGYAGGGGINFIRSIQPGGEWGDMSADIYGAVQEHKPQWLQNIEPGGFMGAMVPGKMDYEDKKRAEEAAKAEEEKAKKDKAAALQAQAGQYKQQFAGGGIASFGAGRYLQGPGDGMSDSIKANIDGKQEARLATGEFVVPADVVSHLGNGDSSAGAKQLHSMMDRARMSRTGTKTQGKQINPRKVMPV